MIGSLFASLWAKIAAGAILALIIALGVVMWRADAISAQRDALRADLATCEARHAVTRASVATLEAVIADLNEQAEQRAAAFAEAQELAKEREAELDRLSRSSGATIARLRELANEPGQCGVPDELRQLAEDL